MQQTSAHAYRRCNGCRILCAAGGAQSGRAAAAEKQLERMKAEGLVEKPFVPKRRSFTFPPVEKMGTNVVDIKVGAGLHCGCLFVVLSS
jgi:hypothetical protein